MNPALDEFKTLSQKTVAQLKEDLKSIRSGRANPAMIEGIIAEVYSGSTKLKLMELATILADDPTMLSVTPYDPSTLQDIEKAIRKSPLGLNPQPQGIKILVRIPPMNEEQRKKMTKIISQKVEEKKESVRNFRDDARRRIKHLHESKEITEDQKFRFEKEIETVAQSVMTEIQDIKDKKEQEIMSV